MITCVGGLFTVLSACLPLSISGSDVLAKRSQQQLQSSAAAIAVKLLSSAGVLGSGVLIKKQGAVYTVVTNAHVLRAGEPPYRLQTWDGHIYSASLLQNNRFKQNDLALLQFRSPHKTYTVALLSSSFNLSIGQDVFAAGYAFADDEFRLSQTRRKQNGLKEFVFKSGKVSLMLNKPLEGGYQVGYTNQIEKGMSGGPLLNRWGEVVGINGKHAYPLWDAPSVFQDGSHACSALHKLINRTSWAVPIESLVQLAPSSIKLNSRLIPLPQLLPTIQKEHC